MNGTERARAMLLVVYLLYFIRRVCPVLSSSSPLYSPLGTHIAKRAKGAPDDGGTRRRAYAYAYYPSRVPRSMTMGFSNPPLD